MCSQQVVKFGNKPAYCRYKLYKSFRYKNHAEIVSVCRTVSHRCTYLLYYFVQRHILCLDFFRYNTDIRLALQGTLKGYMAGRASHKLDEMPILTCGVTVALDVAYQFRICLCSRIKAERCFYLAIFQVAVDGFRTSDNLYTVLLCRIIFSQNTGIGI